MAVREADFAENKGQKDLVSLEINRYLLKCDTQILLAVFLIFLQVFPGNYISQKPKLEVF